MPPVHIVYIGPPNSAAPGPVAMAMGRRRPLHIGLGGRAANQIPVCLKSPKNQGAGKANPNADSRIDFRRARPYTAGREQL